MRYLLHDVFIESYKKNKDSTVIVQENGDKFTYGDLNTLANRFGNLFKNLKADIRKNPYLGIISPVDANSIAAVLGILKIGGTYVPLDEYSPTQRLEHIVNNTKLDTVVINSNLFEKHKALFKNSYIKSVILLDDFHEIDHEKIIKIKDVLKTNSDEPEIINQVSDDLAYILHSSGSTGIPKGIMLTHRNARTFVDWMHKEFKLTSSDRVISRAPFKFDLSVFDIFNTFKAGSTLICFDWNKGRDGDSKHVDYVNLMSREKVSILYTTPSTFITLMNKGNLTNSQLSLRTIMYAGEPFPTPQLSKLMKIIPNTKVANIYGPTETNIITYYWIDKIPEHEKSIPLGDVVDDTEILIVSEDSSHICEPNELGEIWCRGGTVTVGYLGMEEKTKAHLVTSPFHKYPVHFWKTGDYGFRDDQGVFHYRGRKDHMVKVKGFRIELGEVETAIAKYSGIDEFAVVAIPDEKYTNRLYCFYSVLKGHNFSPDDLASSLKSELPEYMIPYRFIPQEEMPKTSSGKIDRVLLTKNAKKN